jgi:hypothetical protein
MHSNLKHRLQYEFEIATRDNFTIVRQLKGFQGSQLVAARQGGQPPT